MMVSFNRTRCRAAAILFLVVASAVGSSSGTSLRSKHLLQREMETSTTTRVNLVNTQTEDSIGSEKEEEGGTFRAEDLLMPIPRSVSVLAQLISLSMQNLERTFRGTLTNESPMVQYSQSFHTTLLQISQKLSNTFQNSIINVQRIKMHSLFVPSKVKEVTGYLGKFNRMTELLYLPLKNLKETTDQTFNLSSQIANYFGELNQLVDEVIKSHNSSKSNKEQQVRNTTAELHRKNEEKKRTEIEILLKEKEIENLKRQKKLDEEEFNKAMDNLNYLQNRESDESQCYWAYNWRTAKHDWWYCPPYKPDTYKIRQVNQTAQAAKIKLEKTMRSLNAKEEETAKKRVVDSDLKIRIERLNHELHQLNEDGQVLWDTTIPLTWLRKSLQKLDKSWKKFVAICGNLQSGVTKSLNIVEEANRTSANNLNKELSESILFNLRKTEEDLSLIEIVIDIYLEESIKHNTEIVSEVEQMMTKQFSRQMLSCYREIKIES